MSKDDTAQAANWLRQSPWHWQALQTAARIMPCPWWIGAGFLRNLIWDHLHGFSPAPAPDIDVMILDRNIETFSLESRLAQAFSADWSVKNQQEMHEKRGLPPCTSFAMALKYWPEKPTAIAVTLADNGSDLSFLTPFGLSPVFSLQVTPTPFGKSRPDIYLDRINKKNWSARWPDLRIDLP